jgi:predicted DNA-binding transcriptional regulator AlpA
MDPTLPTEVTSNRALYSLPEILQRGGFSKSYLYSLIARQCFPKPSVVLGCRFTRWSAPQVETWLADPQGWIDLHATNAGGVR